MELKDYTTEELRAEIKRRYALKKEEDKKKLRCRNCLHCKQHPYGFNVFLCDTRTWGKKRPRNYCVKPSTPACEKFENKHTLKNIHADFSIIRNDMYWEVSVFKGGEWFHCRWDGYNDSNWWENVAPKVRRKTFKGKNGTEITLEIDFNTNIVNEVL